VGDQVKVHPSESTASVAQILNATRQTEDPLLGVAGQSVGVILDREVDVSRGDWLIAASKDPHRTAYPSEAKRSLKTTVAWMDSEPLVKGRTYWALHGHQWVKAQVAEITHQIDILTLETHPAETLGMNAIGRVQLNFKEPLMAQNFKNCRLAGSMILVDTASHQTSGAVMVDDSLES
jgi:sulfate adenylyltransferase subunit 1